MEVKDIIRQRRIELNMTMRELADAVGVSEGTISRWEITPGVIMGWEEPTPVWYTDPESARAAQEVYDDPELRLLFDAAIGSKRENILLAAEMLKRFKETNPDG